MGNQCRELFSFHVVWLCHMAFQLDWETHSSLYLHAKLVHSPGDRLGVASLGSQKKCLSSISRALAGGSINWCSPFYHTRRHGWLRSMSPTDSGKTKSRD